MMISHWPQRGLAAARASFGRHSALLTNAGAITAGNLVAAMLGFVYWWLAARSFSAADVGYAAAAVSLMNLLAQIGEFGMGPLLISEVQAQAGAKAAFISAAVAATLFSSLVLGLVCIALGHALSIGLGQISGGLGSDSIFLFGVVMTGGAVVIDQAFVAMLKSNYPLIRMVSFALLKLLLLGALTFVGTGSAREEAIFASWVAGTLLSLLVLVVVCKRANQTVWRMPDVRLLRPMVGKVLGHHALNVAIQAPALILPFVVTVELSPQINAAFFVAWTLVNLVLLAPATLASVVVAVARREPALLGPRLGFSLALSSVAAVGASIGCLVLSPFVLGLFNPRYVEIAGTSLALLGFGTIGMTVKYHYIAAKRFESRLMSAAMALAAGGVLEICASIFGAKHGGLAGLTCGWLAAVTFEALLMTPTLVAIIRPRAAPLAKSISQSEGLQVHATI